MKLFLSLMSYEYGSYNREMFIQELGVDCVQVHLFCTIDYLLQFNPFGTIVKACHGCAYAEFYFVRPKGVEWWIFGFYNLSVYDQWCIVELGHHDICRSSRKWFKDMLVFLLANLCVIVTYELVKILWDGKGHEPNVC